MFTTHHVAHKKEACQAIIFPTHKSFTYSFLIPKGMFHEKCAFCESHITHISYAEIEHFKPKSKFPSLCFEWGNLLLCCSVCNNKQHKGNKFPEAVDGGPFVNPVEEEPNDFFEFEFDKMTGTASVIPLNPRGEITETTLGLNRPALVKRRTEMFLRLAYVAIKAREGDNDAQQILIEACLPDKEYAAFARMLAKRFEIEWM